jgi:hypothetical protein
VREVHMAAFSLRFDDDEAEFSFRRSEYSFMTFFLFWY